MTDIDADPSSRMAALASWLPLARAASLEYFGTRIEVDSKDDGSPVTKADRAVERVLTDAIRAAFPDDALLGEEFGEHPGRTPWRWLLDPIDGTASFVRGLPLWGTLIGLEHRSGAGERTVVAGIADFPAMGEQLVAPSTRVAWWNRGPQTARCQTSGCTELAAAMVCTTSTEYFKRARCMQVWQQLGVTAGGVRGWSDCVALLLLATGRVDVVIEPVMHPWDIGPFAAILPAASARWSSMRGATQHLDGSMVAAASAPLHRSVLAAIGPS